MQLNIRRTTCATLIICLSLVISACGKVIPTVQPSITPSPSLTATITPTSTITPTPTLVPPVAVLLAPPASDQNQVRNLQTELNGIITSAGLRWQVRQQLGKDDLTPELRLVVAVPPDTGLAELAASAPSTQFLALGIAGLSEAPNLTTIGANGERPDQQGFVAGVIAAMLTDDWRVGVISLSDTVAGKAAGTGFLNGETYFCGLCRPAHPPFYEYPFYIELPSTASTAEWQAAANYMVDHEALTVYVYPGAGDEAMFAILGEAKVNIISGGEPPQSAQSSWVVSLTTDPMALIKAEVAGLLEGSIKGGQALDVPIELTQINTSLFTPGKQRLAEQILSDLQAGFIDTGVDSSTGENRP